MHYNIGALIVLFHVFAGAESQTAYRIPFITESSITKIFIVRHADKQLQGDDLTIAGVKRALELKRLLSQASIDSVFSTNFTRTKKTAGPLAAFRGVPVIIYASEATLINRIIAGSSGKKVLVVGHSNTVPNLIRECGCTPPPVIAASIPDSQFDNLFLVILQKIVVNGVATSRCEVIHLKYGAVTN